MALHHYGRELLPDERAWLALIARQPDDVTTRLVFADWLEDRDRPERAEQFRRSARFVEFHNLQFVRTH